MLFASLVRLPLEPPIVVIPWPQMPCSSRCTLCTLCKPWGGRAAVDGRCQPASHQSAVCLPAYSSLTILTRSPSCIAWLPGASACIPSRLRTDLALWHVHSRRCFLSNQMPHLLYLVSSPLSLTEGALADSRFVGVLDNDTSLLPSKPLRTGEHTRAFVRY